MQMQKRKFRIGDLAKKLDLDKFVIRFWEKEFTLNAERSNGGQRFYEEKDLETFCQIKFLLYEQKFTIAGAKEQLKNKGILAVQKTSLNCQEDINQIDKKGIARSNFLLENKNKTKAEYKTAKVCSQGKIDQKTITKLLAVKANLIKLKQLL